VRTSQRRDLWISIALGALLLLVQAPRALAQRAGDASPEPVAVVAEARDASEPDAVVIGIKTASVPLTPQPHVRIVDPDLRQILERAAAGSPTLRSLIARLDDSDVIAYVRCDQRLRSRIASNLAFMSTAGGFRYVQIHVACGGSEPSQAVRIGHELRHAVEVADLRAIVDLDSFDREYARIGVRRPAGGDVPRSYETENAVRAGEQIVQELRRVTN
jgi:hypothetical protein